MSGFGRPPGERGHGSPFAKRGILSSRWSESWLPLARVWDPLVVQPNVTTRDKKTVAKAPIGARGRLQGMTPRIDLRTCVFSLLSGELFLPDAK